MFPKQSIEQFDPELDNYIKQELKRQWSCIELIASENFTFKSVLEAQGSCLTNKYSEGRPGARYYGGNEFIDKIERLAEDRALKAFNLDPKEWGVNVQPYSGSPANFAAYNAFLQPHDRLLGMSLIAGGHLTHGHNVSTTGKYFQSMQYGTDENTGLINYQEVQFMATNFKPKLIIIGASAYPRDYDYAKFREIANSCGAILLMDMAHTSGLIASGLLNNPFNFCDVVTTTTHKTLRGPRGALIFYKRQYEKQMNMSVFPGVQGGPHNQTIAGIATNFLNVMQPEFKEYCSQIIKNAQALSQALVSRGYRIVSGGTDNHLILIDLKPLDLTGSKLQEICDHVNITLNKNSVQGDKVPANPGGIRVGTPAMTTRGAKEADMELIAEFIHEVVQVALEVQKASGRMLADFKNALQTEEVQKKLNVIKEKVTKFATSLEFPGFDVSQFKA